MNLVSKSFSNQDISGVFSMIFVKTANFSLLYKQKDDWNYCEANYNWINETIFLEKLQKYMK